ncbi:MAG: beta-lactamase family protein [Planctomycetaceae bacterium]|nr:beta-lactamase family protein [Planctomycetaceae bacterium]
MDFPLFEKIVTAGLEKQLHLGVQLSLANDERQVDVAFGEVRAGVPLSPGDSLSWLSACKPITAVAILQLVDQGKFSLDTPLNLLLPQFRYGPAGEVTIFQILTHTSPLEEFSTGWPAADWIQVLDSIAHHPLKNPWDDETDAAYLPSVSWFILGAILEQATGQDYSHGVQNQVLLPAGMTQTTAAGSKREVTLYDRVSGKLESSAYQNRLNARQPSPGSSFCGPARDLCRFYEQLRLSQAGKAGGLLSAALMKEMTQRWRKDRFDQTLQHKVDYGLGVIINSSRYGSETVPYGYGENASEGAFGHGGSQCSIGFTDPERGRSIVIIANGRPGEGQHQRRFRQLLAALDEDLQNLPEWS